MLIAVHGTLVIIIFHRTKRYFRMETLMHLLFDATSLKKHLDGISRYSIGVINALLKVRPDWEYSILVAPEAAVHLEDLPVRTAGIGEAGFNRGISNAALQKSNSSKADCYLNFSSVTSSPSIPEIITVQNLMSLNFYGFHGNSFLKNFIERNIFRMKLKKSLQSASAISVSAEITLAELQNTFPDSVDKVFVTGEGQDLFSGDEVVNSARKGYILYVGNARAYKNVTRLIVAYSRLKAINPKFPEMSMVVRRDRAFKNFMREIDDCSARDSITVLSEIADEELKQLYRECIGLVIPSLKEGFGLPALEAMAAGSPVVASSGTALEELVGDAGIYVDPESIESIMHGMAMLTSQHELRSSLSVKAFKRAGNYSWEKTAEIIADRIEAISS